MFIFFAAGFVLLMLLNGLPFSYHVRLCYHCIVGYFTKIPASEKLGQASILSSVSSVSFRCWPDGLDLNMHMNNSYYNLLCDFARYQHLIRMGVNLQDGASTPANGGVYMRFKRPIAPFEAFELKTRVCGWDNKWMLVEHTLVVKGRAKAAGICKIVVPGVTPEQAFTNLGYMSPDKPDTEQHLQQLKERGQDLATGRRALEGLIECEKWMGKDDPVSSPKRA